MPETTLSRLLERNASHVDSLPEGYFSSVEESQQPAAVSVCCSDSRVSQEGMWDVEEPGWLFTPSTIGNQVWDRNEGQRVVDGSVLYPMAFTDTSVTAVVGHTGCGAVTAALEAVQNDGVDAPAGVEKWVDLLVPVVEDGLADDRIDSQRAVSLVDQLVEYNVDRQVQFLLDSDDVPADESVYGFVYDFQGVYGDARGRAYLVNADGETDTDTLEELVPESFTDHVHRLL
ncbi:MAG: carbonic anhydrase [Haloarculaceae archaeon]|jgi:carbonic anhydrase